MRNRKPCGAFALLAGLVATQAGAGTNRITLDFMAAETDAPSVDAAISGNGRYVVFASAAAQLVPGDTNMKSDVFRYDIENNTIEIVSVSSTGNLGNDDSYDPSISHDGRYIAFYSRATNFATQTQGVVLVSPHVFVRDMLGGATRIASINSAGELADSLVQVPRISPDGAVVSFASHASNLAPNDTTDVDVFTKGVANPNSLATNISIGVNGQGGGAFGGGSLSELGRYVAFASNASDIVAGDNNGFADVFVRDRFNNRVERVSVGSGAPSNGASDQPVMSRDGRYVAFASYATNLLPGATLPGNIKRIYRWDRQLSKMERVSAEPAAGSVHRDSVRPAISPSGDAIVYLSRAAGMDQAGDLPNHDVVNLYLRLMGGPSVQLVSANANGREGNLDSGSLQGATVGKTTLSDDGFIAYESDATDLIAMDANNQTDIFLYDRDHVNLVATSIIGATSTPAQPAPPAAPNAFAQPLQLNITTEVRNDGDIAAAPSTTHLVTWQVMANGPACLTDVNSPSVSSSDSFVTQRGEVGFVSSLPLVNGVREVGLRKIAGIIHPTPNVQAVSLFFAVGMLAANATDASAQLTINAPGPYPMAFLTRLSADFNSNHAEFNESDNVLVRCRIVQ